MISKNTFVYNRLKYKDVLKRSSQGLSQKCDVRKKRKGDCGLGEAASSQIGLPSIQRRRKEVQRWLVASVWVAQLLTGLDVSGIFAGVTQRKSSAWFQAPV